MSEPGSPALAADPPISARSAAGVLAGCLVAVFMQMLDMTMVNTALPVMTADLGARDSNQLLIAAAYSMAFACGLLPAARVGDTVGRRRVYLTGMAALQAASLCSAVANGPWEMVAARGAQGLCAAFVSAQTLAVIAATFDRSRQPLVFGLYGATAGLAAIAGPLLGGVLVAADPLDLGWRAVFLVNIPLGLVALTCMGRSLPADAPAASPRLDRLGAALSTLILLGVLYPVTRGTESGWTLASSAMIATATALAVVFVGYQRRVRAAGGVPLLRLDLFADRGFAVGAVLMLLFSAMLAGLPLVISVFLQTGLGLSAARTGAMIAPYALAAAVGAVTSPMLMSRFGYRTLTAGMALFAVSIAVIALLLDPASGRLDLAALAVPVALAGLGMGWFAAPLPSVMIADIDPAASGAASGTVPTIQQIGSAIGPAAFGAVLFTAVSARAPDGVADASARLTQRVSAAAGVASSVGDFAHCARTALAAPAHILNETTCATADPTLGAAVDSAARVAAAHTYTAAFTTVLWIIAALATVSAAVTLALPQERG
ncbi:MFS transporter [Nocardia arizonensis]|uniref:MFS transporter n=1 Tax=Nocardia arizonensis TaxID=1141647 RepID=UPI0006D03C8B|nr:MFS transporter [Nocardia arizonensis]